MRKFYAISAFLWVFSSALTAQSPTDGLMMPKRNFCTLAQYATSNWDEYWQGETKRSNSNLGTFTSQNVMLMSNYGISDRLNILAALPYVWTKSSASYLEGQKGIQDLSIWLKYQAWGKKWSSGNEVKVQATGGLSTPLSSYTGDFLPFSIGLHSKTASLRGIVNFTHRSGLYATAQGGHTWRSTITLDRDAFIFNNEVIQSDEMPVPNVLDASGRLGFINKKVQAELWYEYSTGLSGDDIRYNEAPQASNKMQMAAAGVFAKYWITRSIAVQASYSQVLSGRNVGQGTMITAGTTYLFKLRQRSASTPSK